MNVATPPRLDADEPEGTPELRVERRSFARGTGDLRRFADPEKWVSFFVVAGCAYLVFQQMHPQLVFSSSTPTGGDMGAHVWGPAFLRDELLPNFRLSGWTPDWYAGFPAYQFYMVLPALMIVGLNAGLSPFVSVPLSVFIAVTAYSAVRSETARRKPLIITLAVLACLLLISFPYGVAFKIVAISGLVSLPINAWAMGRLADVPFPGPPMLAVAVIPFVFDRSFNIYGGNAASTMAGEFAFAMSLSVALLFIGLAARGLRTGRGGATTAVVFAIVILCHLIPVLFVAAVVAALFFLRIGKAQIRWLLGVVPAGIALSFFWLGPFLLRREYLNDMGWRKIGGWRSADEWADVVSPLLRRHELNPSNILVDSPPIEVVLGLALLGVVLSIARRSHLGIAFTLNALVFAAAFIFMPQGRLWNARLLPFYYISLYVLAGLGLAFAVRIAADSFQGSLSRTGERVCVGIAAGVGALVLAIPLGGLAVLIDRHPGALDFLRPALPALFVATWIVVGGALIGLAIMGRNRLRPGAIGSTSVRSGALLFIAGVVLIAVAMPMGALPGGKWEGSEFRWGPLATADRSFVPGWSKWNFGGYQARQGNADGGGWDEYSGIVATMENVGTNHGCGRAFWEFAPELNRYGTTMAMMLLPFWSDSCIGSMEGLYFESSATVPYHFLLQTELSGPRVTTQDDAGESSSKGGPSQAQRDLPYGTFDIDKGVEHLQLLGVRYYIAFSDTAVTAARAHESLTEVDGSIPWSVFLVEGTDLVEPLSFEPIRLNDVADAQDEWLDVGVEFFNDDQRGAFLSQSGPATWLEATPAEVPGLEPRALDPVTVDNIESGLDTISFSVDNPGTPVLVKTSYFPNWKVRGADGPYRVTPNLMVVIPTDEEVELYYGRTGVDIGSILVTVVGLALLAALVIRPAIFGDGDQPWWDPIERSFRRNRPGPVVPEGPRPFTWSVPPPRR